MAEITLSPEPPLAGYTREFGAVTLSAPPNLALVSVALPLGGETAAQAAMKSGYGAELPEVGRYVTANDGTRLLRLSPDQGMIIFTHATPDAEAVVAAKLGDAVYLTDQTDAWAALEIKGPGTRAALERICPLDLHPASFAADMVQRTMMEHLGTMILRTGDDAFLLLSAASSAGSFLHAVETSVLNST